MAKSKVKSSKAGGFGLAGGKGHMFGKQGVKPSKPGVISESSSGKGAKFASGGKGKMFGFTGSKAATPK